MSAGNSECFYVLIQLNVNGTHLNAYMSGREDGVGVGIERGGHWVILKAKSNSNNL